MIAFRRLALPLLLLAGCENGNVGKQPPLNEMFFPSGMLLDPRALEGEAAKYLFVVNSNNDLAYNAGTVVAIDLDKFFDSWALDDRYNVDPYCDPAYAEDSDHDDGKFQGRCVQQIGSGTSLDYPCRRLALMPQVVECDEKPFISKRHVVRTGDFATVLTSSCNDENRGDDEPCSEPRLWLPVRGDPSVTYIDLVASTDEHPSIFECGQGLLEEEGRCDPQHRLTHLLNDADLVEMEREPFNMLVSPTKPLAYVAHSDGSALSLIDLRQPQQCCYPSREPSCNIDRIRDIVCNDQTKKLDNGKVDAGWIDRCCDPGAAWDSDCIARAEQFGVCRPAMIDQTVAFPSLGGLPGGLGLAERPCTPGDDSPSITLDCARPLVYAAFRYSRLLVSFTVQGVTPEEIDDPEFEQQCAGPGEIDQPHKIACDPRVRSQRQLFPGGLDPGGASFTPVLGDIAFADETGDQLLVVQTNPGALLLLDTSVGPDGEVVDNPSRPPLEICDQPTRMKLYEEAGQRFALISCYRAALIYVVDLDAFRVVEKIVAGTGPFEVEVDTVRRVLYVSNNLEKSISVIDLAQDRPNRFTEIARIGLQEPFSR